MKFKFRDNQTTNHSSTFFSGNGKYLDWDFFDNTTEYGRADSGYYFTFEFGPFESGSTDKLSLGK